MYSSSSWHPLQLLHCSDEMIPLSLFMLVICDVELEVCVFVLRDLGILFDLYCSEHILIRLKSHV